MKFLDQLAFEQYRFRFAADDVNVEVVDSLDQRVELQVPAQPSRRMKILAHPLPQIARFAGVNHRPKPVLHEINTRFVRQLAQLAANLIRDGHRENVTQKREGAKEFLARNRYCAAEPQLERVKFVPVLVSSTVFRG